ncbi:MAG: HipA N-terminal domain-containing protein [Gracilimonas sp.]|uniref:HipA N-terminal domain-containing protein n=1 Tax=Gracilimonas sp. TaxID=1974203 RepID=UPI001B24DC9E|nr:HipA N-terminal domain-containing protein [Gracilimonas sp.]MBO6585122.1 HipA N-terminal domain-containing protein [Gracilimonas sp.]MBO6615606.1 HipA N-terminal domain-containing protein [Gracilimonas sp.]
MRKAKVYMHNNEAGLLIEDELNQKYRFIYDDSYKGKAISVTMPVEDKEFKFEHFPPFFEGLLPEGVNLEALLRSKKIDRNDRFAQLMAVGEDTVGAVTVKEVKA